VNTQQPLIYWQHARDDGIPKMGDVTDLTSAGVSGTVMFTTHDLIAETFNRWTDLYPRHLDTVREAASLHHQQACLRSWGGPPTDVFFNYEGGYTYDWSAQLSHPHAIAKLKRTSLDTHGLTTEHHDAAMGRISEIFRHALDSLAGQTITSPYHPIRALNTVSVRDLAHGTGPDVIFRREAQRTALVDGSDQTLLHPQVLGPALWIHAYDAPHIMDRMGITQTDAFRWQTRYQTQSYLNVTGRLPERSYICRWAESPSTIDNAARAYAELLPELRSRNTTVPALYIATPERAIPQSEAREAIKRAADIIGSAHSKASVSDPNTSPSTNSNGASQESN